MKVFLSWSGELSHKVACVFRDWMPSVIQVVRPYVSSEDIDKGTRWSTDIAQELEESTYGVLCVTRENLAAPWINFEAGALSKTIDKSNVSPFLFQIKRSEVHGPLLQFQSTVYEKDDVAKLMQSINNRLQDRERLDDVLLRKSFDVWWPQLEEQLDALTAQAEKPAGEKGAKRDASARGALQDSTGILEELLELARSQQKLLRSPEDLLPPAYLEFALRHSRRVGDDDRSRDKMWNLFHRRLTRFVELVHTVQNEVESPRIAELADEADRLHSYYHQIAPGVAVRKARLLVPAKPTTG